MKLTNEEVERIKKMSCSKQTVDLACDNLAMWAMLKAIVANLEFAVSPGAPLTVEVLERHIRGQVIKIKELLG